MASTALVVIVVASALVGMRPAAAAPANCPSAVASAATAQARARACGKAVEALAQRSATARTFANPDGTFRLEVSAAPRWVKRPDGSWSDIDTSLLVQADSSIAPVATTVPVRFSGGGTGPLVTASTPGGELTLSWPAALPAPRIDGDAAVYENVFPDVDLRVRALPTGFTYVLVVRTQVALANPALRRIPVAVSGLTLRQRTDGGVEAVREDGTVVLASGGASMWDSSGGLTGATAAQLAAARASGTISSPNGPGDRARNAPVAVTVAAQRLVLSPDPMMLANPALTLPVYIDPQISGPNLNRWAYANSTNSNNNDGVARVGISPDGSGIYRSFFEFNLAPVAGTHILAASFDTVLTHSWSCGNTLVSLYWTGGITAGVNGTRVGWSPGLQQWLDERAGHAHKPSTGAGCGDDPQPDQAMHFGNLLTGKVQEWASVGAGAVTLGLSAMSQSGANESATDRWKKFRVPDTGLTILYNSYPGTPQTSALSTTGTSQSIACFTGAVADQPKVSVTNGVQFVAPLTDNDSGDILVARFEWQDVTAGSAVVALPDTPGFTSPHTYTVSLPGASVPDGHSVRWRVHGWDGTDSGAVSAWCQFAVDNSTPGQPTLSSTDLPPFPDSPPVSAVVGAPGSVRAVPAAGDTDIVGYYYGVGSVETAPTSWIPARADGSATIPVVPVVSGLAKNFLTVVAVNAAGSRSPVPVSEADAPGTREFFAQPGTVPGVRHDLTGDRYADIPAVVDAGNGVTKLTTFLAKTDGSVFDPVTSIVNDANAFPDGKITTLVGDFSGDGRADLAAVRDDGGCRTSLWWWISTANGYRPSNTAIWDSGPGNWCYANGTKMVAGDFNGDGKDDIGAYHNYSGGLVKLFVFLTNSTGTGLQSGDVWWDSGPGNWEYSNFKAVAGDFNGDGKDDIAQIYDYYNCAMGIWVFTSNGSSMNPPQRTYYGPANTWCVASTTQVLAGDVNGDGKDDFNAIYNYGSGNWRIWTFYGPGVSAGSWTGNNSGYSDATKLKAVMADFNGDGRADLGHFYNSGTNRATLWVLYSTGTTFTGENSIWDAYDIKGGLSWPTLRPL